MRGRGLRASSWPRGAGKNGLIMVIIVPNVVQLEESVTGVRVVYSPCANLGALAETPGGPPLALLSDRYMSGP